MPKYTNYNLATGLIEGLHEIFNIHLRFYNLDSRCFNVLKGLLGLYRV